MVQKLLLFY